MRINGFVIDLFCCAMPDYRRKKDFHPVTPFFCSSFPGHTEVVDFLSYTFTNPAQNSYRTIQFLIKQIRCPNKIP